MLSTGFFSLVGLWAKHTKFLICHYILEENTEEAIAYIYSNTKAPNYVVCGTKLKFEAYKIKHKYEGNSREENKTTK